METKTIAYPQTKSIFFEYTLIALAFLIPLFISGPQFLTGTVVNSLIFLFALQQPNLKRTLPFIIAPSIGTIGNGILFGTVTHFLFYFLPFIWMANYVLIVSFKSLLKKNSLIVSVVGSGILKFLTLFFVAYLFTIGKIVPSIFIQFMGLFQLYTALAGGILALGIHTIIKNTYD